MPAVTVQPLAEAIAAAVEARGLAYGDGDRPAVTGSKPFVVGWLDAGTLTPRTMTPHDGQAVVLVAHCVGASPRSARWAAERLTSALLSLHLTTVDGRTVQWPVQLSSRPLQRDDNSDPPLYELTVEWRIRTTPA